MSGIILDAESVREEVFEVYSLDAATAIEGFTDEEINGQIREVAGDAFWAAYDEARSDAIARLLEARGLSAYEERHP